MSKYKNPVFINQSLANPAIKTASKFISYKTWNDPSVWFAEVIDNGNAFFHWHQGQKAEGHKDTIINYHTGDGTQWQATIKDYVFFHAPHGEVAKGHSDNKIVYISADDQPYEATFAEWFDE